MMFRIAVVWVALAGPVQDALRAIKRRAKLLHVWR